MSIRAMLALTYRIVYRVGVTNGLHHGEISRGLLHGVEPVTQVEFIACVFVVVDATDSACARHPGPTALRT